MEDKIDYWHELTVLEHESMMISFKVMKLCMKGMHTKEIETLERKQAKLEKRICEIRKNLNISLD